MSARLAALDDITDDGRYTSRIFRLATEPACEPGREPVYQKQNLLMTELSMSMYTHTCNIYYGFCKSLLLSKKNINCAILIMQMYVVVLMIQTGK